jgi:hypothetical protein
MKASVTATCAALLWIATPAIAHRLDEYLQATLISVEKDRVQLHMHLTPGVAVFPFVLAMIDADRDGVIAEAEQRAYAARVLRDLSLTADGDRLTPRLVSMTFPKTAEMKEGMGEIQLEFDADVPGGGPRRQLIFENHHQSQIAAYQVNCLAPRDPEIRVIAQNRNYTQSFYELKYAQPGIRPLSLAWWSGSRGFFGAFMLFFFARLAFLLRLRARAAKVVLVPGVN